MKRILKKQNLLRSLLFLTIILTLVLSPVLISAGMDKKETAEDSQAEAEAAEEKKQEKAPEPFNKEDMTIRIAIDPGHGGKDSGAYGFGKNEKDLTLKVSKYIKKELEKYENVEVFLTRTDDRFVHKNKRTTIAVEKKADLLVSVHFDAYDPSCLYHSGSSVITPVIGSWHKKEAKESTRLARSILQCLEDIGLDYHGVIRKRSTIGERYEDGSLADYYAIVRNGMYNNLPSILVEGAFIDNDYDFHAYLSSNKKMKKIAKAEADGIARYLQLVRKSDGSVLKPVLRKGKKMRIKGDRNAYYSLARKAYYYEQYQKMMKAGSARLNSNESAEDELAADTGITVKTEQGSQLVVVLGLILAVIYTGELFQNPKILQNC